MKRFFRCKTCAQGAAIELRVPKEVIAIIVSCPQVYERGDQKFTCPGPMVHRTFRHEEVE